MAVMVVRVAVIVVRVAVIVAMAMGGGGNHPEMLYYNITEVHGRPRWQKQRRQAGPAAFVK